MMPVRMVRQEPHPGMMPVQEGCGVPSWKGDKYCDNENNNAGCEWDGGDCCGNTMDGWDYYCKPNCQCLDPNNSGGSGGACFCGVKNEASRITGGSEAAPNEYPWQVALINKAGSYQFCGGSIVNSKYVVTAAHCTAGSTASEIVVRVGVHDLSVAGGSTIDVAKIIDHPTYNKETLVNDYSILKLATPLTFSDKVRPVCLPTSSAPTFAGVTGVASGWGRLATDKPGPSAMHHVELDVYGADGCMNWKTLHPSMICAGGKDGKAVCNGDSGGPLVTYENGRWTLIGVSSFVSTAGCEAPGWPSVFARVTNQLDWINKNIADGEFCPAPNGP